MPGCGSPYLVYHHFDPPWSVREHHDVRGIIALCLQHHIEADHGAFTADQIRTFKREPFLEQGDVPVDGRFNWMRQQIVLLAGGGFYVRCPVFLRVAGRPMIWLASRGGVQTLNLDVWDANGQLAFSMRDNQWVALGDLHDVECPPKASSLILRAPDRDLHVAIDFKCGTPERVRALLRKRQEDTEAASARMNARMLARLTDSGAPEGILASFRDRPAPIDQTEELAARIYESRPQEEVALCTLRAHLPFPLPVDINSRRVLLPGNNQILGMFASDSPTAISLM